MADSTPLPPSPNRSPGAFAAGIAVGVVFGGFLLTIVIFFPVMGLMSSSPAIAFVVSYVVGIALGASAFSLTRRATNFWTGLMIGSAAGLLGATALCNAIVALSAS